jgi:hypothetical protein
MSSGTAKSPNGRPVPIQWLQDAVDLLVRKGEIAVDVEAIGHRSAFVTAFFSRRCPAVARPTTLGVSRLDAEASRSVKSQHTRRRQ